MLLMTSLRLIPLTFGSSTTGDEVLLCSSSFVDSVFS
jgi:hypothetical protein